MGFRYRWFDKHVVKQDDMGIPLNRACIDKLERGKIPTKKYYRGEKSGMTIAAVFTLYGIYTKDIALTFFCISLFFILINKLINQDKGKINVYIANIFKGFSMALMGGAILMAFM